ncbi:MAG: fused MFS/spermidine synthase [Pseudomonadota bacterium]
MVKAADTRADDARRSLFHAVDEHGVVEVWQSSNGLILGLGNEVEQTRILAHSPQHLCFDYMRIMLLALLWKPKPKRALILGLGGGAQARSLLARFPKLELDAVELRPAVVEAAYQALKLPQDARMQVHVMDALDFVRSAQAKRYDLIFVDLFDRYGMAPIMADAEFMQHCARILGARGALAANLWRYPLEDYLAATMAMQQAFPWLGFVASRARDQNIALAAHDAPGGVRELGGIAQKHEAELPAFWRDFVQQNAALFRR